MKKKVFGTRHYREQEEGEYLSDVTGAAEESQLSGEPAPREHAVHVNVVQLADEEPGGRRAGRRRAATHTSGARNYQQTLKVVSKLFYIIVNLWLKLNSKFFVSHLEFTMEY